MWQFIKKKKTITKKIEQLAKLLYNEKSVDIGM